MIPINKGKELSESKLNDVVKKLRPSDKDDVIEKYSYIISNEFENNDDKIKELVCSMPSAGNFSANLIYAQLQQGPMCKIPAGHKTVNYFIDEIKANYPNECERICNYMEGHKHCPERFKTKHMLLQVAIQQMIDYYLFDIGHADTDTVVERVITHLTKQSERFGDKF